MNIINQWGEPQKEGEGEGAIFKVPWGGGKGGEHDFWLKFSGGGRGPGRKLCWKIRLLIEASLKGRHNCNIKNSKVILWSSQNVLIQNQWDLCKKKIYLLTETVDLSWICFFMAQANIYEPKFQNPKHCDGKMLLLIYF